MSPFTQLPMYKIIGLYTPKLSHFNQWLHSCKNPKPKSPKPKKLAVAQSPKMNGDEQDLASVPPEMTALVGALVWSRVEALRELDAEVEKMEAAFTTVLECQQRIHARVRDELGTASRLAWTTMPTQPPLQRSFTYYFARVVALLTFRG